MCVNDDDSIVGRGALFALENPCPRQAVARVSHAITRDSKDTCEKGGGGGKLETTNERETNALPLELQPRLFTRECPS